jgi:uncharacterized membrane protein (DUF2068 family)
MVIILMLLNAVTLALVAILVYFDQTGVTSGLLQALLAFRAVDYLASALLVVFAAAMIVIAVGLWRLRRWAWVGTMIVIGVSLASDILSYFHGNPYYGSMVLHVFTVFYLNDRDVQNLFERRRARELSG